MQDQRQEGLVVGGPGDGPGPPSQLCGGDQEPEQDRDQTEGEGREPPPAAQIAALDGLLPLAGVMVAGAAAGEALHQGQDKDEAQQHGRKLGGRRGAAKPEPGAEDAGGEGRHPEVLHGAVVRQGLHQGQGQPRHDGRSGERQGDGEEGPPRAVAQGPAHVQNAQGLAEEGGTGEQVDVGVKDQGEQHRRTRQGANLGEPVVRKTPAGGGAQGRLQRPREVQQPSVGIGDDVRRHGHGQEQGPFEDTASRKSAHAGQPGGAHPSDQGAQGHPGHEQQGVGHVVGQHRLSEVLPHLAGWDEQEPDDHQHRQSQHQGQPRDPGTPPASPPASRTAAAGSPVTGLAGGRNRHWGRQIRQDRCRQLR